MASKPKMPAAPKMDIGGDIAKYVAGYTQALPSVFGLESQYRPQFQGLNLADISAFLGGTAGQQGIVGMSGDLSRQAGTQISDLRGQELGQMTGQAGLTRGLMDILSPEQKYAVQEAQNEAQRAYTASQGLTPQEQRMAQQQAREGFASAGRLGGNASVVQEAMNRENVLSAKRNEAAQAGGRLYDMASQFYTQPGLSLLGSTPLSYQAGQQTLGLGLGAIGAGTPQMINPDTGANLGMQYTTNLFNRQAAQAQAKASYSGGLFGGIGSAIGGLTGIKFG